MHIFSYLFLRPFDVQWTSKFSSTPCVTRRHAPSVGEASTTYFQRTQDTRHISRGASNTIWGYGYPLRTISSRTRFLCSHKNVRIPLSLYNPVSIEPTEHTVLFGKRSSLQCTDLASCFKHVTIWDGLGGGIAPTGI